MDSQTMLYIDSPYTDPYLNLALEEYAFEYLGRTQPCFLLWQNDNTIVVGKYQNTAEEINRNYVEDHHIRIARRLSGGGAVYHDKGNLNFTFIVEEGACEDFDFKYFVLPIVKALETLGVQAQFNGRNDITINGKKFSGNSQYVRSGRLLHHGCIMLNTNLEVVSQALKTSAAKFESKSTKSVRSRVTTINENVSKPISTEKLKAALLAAVEEGQMVAPYHLAAEELNIIQNIAKEKYATWEWIYGRSPAYSMQREKKFPSGLVTAHLNAEAGRIKEIHLYGDFFGNRDLDELERTMVGLPLDGALTEALRVLGPEQYMHGISAEQLAELLLG